jgi:hypothetical protein
VFPLAAFPAIVVFSVALTFAQSRYRAPAEAALAVLAAVAVDALVERALTRRRAREEPASPPDEPVPVSNLGALSVRDPT